MIEWTQDLDDIIRRERAAGEAYSAIAALIAEKIGRRVSKGSVLGRANRIGLCLPKGARQPRTAPLNLPTKPAKAKAKPPRPNWEALFAAPRTAPEGGISFMDLDGRKHCRQPLWGAVKPSMDTMRFCGETPMAGSSYCPACHYRNFTQPKQGQSA